jgi:hypothetical protein
MHPDWLLPLPDNQVSFDVAICIDDRRSTYAFLVKELCSLLRTGFWTDGRNFAGHYIACYHLARSFGC